MTTPCPTFSGASSFLRLILMWSTKCFICQSGKTQQLMQILAIILTSSSLSVHRPLPCPRLFPQQRMDTLLTLHHLTGATCSTVLCKSTGIGNKKCICISPEVIPDLLSGDQPPTVLTTRVSPLPVCSGSCIPGPCPTDYLLSGQHQEPGDLTGW